MYTDWKKTYMYYARHIGQINRGTEGTKWRKKNTNIYECGEMKCYRYRYRTTNQRYIQ